MDTRRQLTTNRTTSWQADIRFVPREVITLANDKEQLNLLTPLIIYQPLIIPH